MVTFGYNDGMREAPTIKELGIIALWPVWLIMSPILLIGAIGAVGIPLLIVIRVCEALYYGEIGLPSLPEIDYGKELLITLSDIYNDLYYAWPVLIIGGIIYLILRLIKMDGQSLLSFLYEHIN